MKLYELNEQIELLENQYMECINLETGQIDNPELLEHIEEVKQAMTIEKESKSLNLAKLIKNTDSDVNAIDAEIKNLQARKTTLNNKSDWFKGYLTSILRPIESEKGETFKDSQAVISWRKSESVTILDDSLLSSDYTVEKITTSPDKKLIKQVIKDGFTVEGAELKLKYGLGIK